MSQYKKYRDLIPAEKTENFQPNVGVSESRDNVVEIQNIQHKQQLISENNIVVVDVYGTFCQPCKSMASRYANLADKYGKPGICCLAKEDVEKKISTQVQGVPTLQFFKQGKYITPDVVGVDLPAVEKRILEMLNS